jgi:hypothetical protein
LHAASKFQDYLFELSFFFFKKVPDASDSNPDALRLNGVDEESDFL